MSHGGTGTGLQIGRPRGKEGASEGTQAPDQLRIPAWGRSTPGFIVLPAT